MIKLFQVLLRIAPGTVALAIVMGMIGGTSAAALLALINAALSQSVPAVGLLALGFGAIALVTLLTGVGSQLLMIRLAQGAIYDLRMRLVRRVLAVPLRQLEELGSQRIFPALTDDVLAITDALLGIPLICINAATILACLVYLGWLSWLVLVTVIGFMLLGVVSFQLLAASGLRSLRAAREAEDRLFHHFRALTEGTKELKLHRQRRQSFLTTLLEPSARVFRDSSTAGISLYTTANGWGQIIFFLYIGLLLFALPGLMPTDARLLTGTVLIVLYMKTPLDVIMGLIPRLGRASVALEKVEALGLSLRDDDLDDAVSVATLDAATLELIGVTHTYRREREDGQFVLGPIDLRLEPGELVFLVGSNGSGKTTLAKLITGLYAPESGAIHLNGRPITHENCDWYRQHFAAVFADFYLFESLLGLSAADLDAAAQQYLVQLQLDHKVQIAGGTLSTTALSQGQRKRLALLNAYLEDRPVYLFDEWAADQDPVFKKVFYTSLLPALKLKGKLVVVITHDDAYCSVADRVIKLDYGKLVPVAAQPLAYADEDRRARLNLS